VGREAPSLRAPRRDGLRPSSARSRTT
jgi:hypothetical protein